MAALSVTTHKATRTATNFFKNDRDFERRQARARSEDADDKIEPDEEPNEFQKSIVIRSRKMNVRMSWMMEAWIEVTRVKMDHGDDSEEVFEDDKSGPMMIWSLEELGFDATQTT